MGGSVSGSWVGGWVGGWMGGTRLIFGGVGWHEGL